MAEFNLTPPDPTDDASTDYISHRQDVEGRLSPEVLARMQAVATQQAPSAAEEPTEKEKEKPKGVMGDIWQGTKEALPQIAGGAMDAITEAGQALESAGDWLTDHWDWLKEVDEQVGQFNVDLPDVAAPESTTGTLIRGTSQFLTGFLPALKATKVLGIGGTIAKGMVAGAAADATVFDPMDDNVSNLIQQFPVLQNPVTEYLAAAPEDSEATGRFKKVLEGLGLGVASEGLAIGFGAFKKLKGVAKGADDVAGAAKASEVKPKRPHEMSRDEYDMMAQEKIKADPNAATELPQYDDMMAQALKDGKVTRAADGLFDAVGAEPRIDDRLLAKDITSKPEFVVKVDPERIPEVIRKLRGGEFIDPTEVADFNWSRIESEEDMQQVITVLSDTYADAMTKAKGGPVRKHKVVEQIAEQTGSSVKAINHMYGATQHMDSDFLAARDLLASSAKAVAKQVELVNQIGGDTSANLLLLRRGVTVHAALQAQVKGIQTNVARTLSAMKIKATGMLDQDALDAALNAVGGRDTMKRFAKKFSSLADDPVKANKLVRDAQHATTVDAVLYYWINSILSGPATQMVNIVSNTCTMAAEVLETGFAGMKTAITGKGEVTLGEATAKGHGMMLGFLDAIKVSSEALKATSGSLLRGDFKGAKAVLKATEGDFGNMWRAGATGKPITDAVSRFEVSGRGISGEAFGWTGTAGKAADLMGSIIGLPGRALITSDEIFKTMAMRGELHALAARKMAASGLNRLKGPLGKAKRRQFLEDFMQNTPNEAVSEALEKGRYLTFQNELGDIGRKGQKFLNSSPYFQFVVPFVRTPVNIIKYVGHRTPLVNRLCGQMKADLAAGGARAELAKAKVAMGTMLYAGGTMLAANGMITGAGTRDSVNADRWIKRQEASVKVGDKWYSFSRLDPFGAFLGIAADTVNLMPYLSEGDYKEFTMGIPTMMIRNVVSKTYVRGLADFIHVITDEDGRYGERWMQKFTSSFIPNFLAQINRSQWDQEMKEINDFSASFYARIPEWSKKVPPKRNTITGEAMQYGQGFLGGVLPFYSAEETDDPVMHALRDTGMSVGQPPKAIDSVDLTPEQYDKYQLFITQKVKLKGKNLHDTLAEIVGDKRFEEMPMGDDDHYEGKQNVLHKVITLFREQGKKAFVRSDPELREAILKKKKEFYHEMLIK